jgi:uncharacterized repeat protein (TIGR02543 family)
VPPCSADFNSTLVEPSSPTRSNYVFAGWYADLSFSRAWAFSSDAITGETTLYAKWTINQYTISFNSNNGSEVSAITQDYASSIVKPTDPTRAGYTFAGWYSDAGLTSAYTFITMPAADTTLYAKWMVNPTPTSTPTPTPPPSFIKGDATGDGKVDALDLLMVKKHLLGQVVITGDNVLAADATGDGRIDALDLLKIKKYLLGQITLG